jgi:short-subunit dehydrogenase
MAFHGKTAIITGGASGMGRVMATRLANQGAKAVILDLNEKLLEDVAAEHPNIIPFKCDVTNLEQVKSIFANVEKNIGPIDRVVHCAALMPGGILAQTPVERICSLMSINYFGTVNITSVALHYLLPRKKGDLIVFGSIAGVLPVPKFGAYGSTKAATNFYMKVLIEENKNSGLRILLVCPPAVNTPLIDQALAEGPKNLTESKKSGKNMASPESVISEVENAIEKNKTVVFTGEAKYYNLLYRLFPTMVARIAAKKS